MREIVFYKRYFLDFFEDLTEEVKRKFDWTFQLISSVERVPVQYFKHIEGTKGLYEVRVEVNSNIYRAFAFFDRGQLVIIANGFHKKSQKTPMNEIDLAKKIQNQYFNETK